MAPVRTSFYIQIGSPSGKRQAKRGLGLEVVRKNLKKCNRSEDLAQDRLDGETKFM